MAVHRLAGRQRSHEPTERTTERHKHLNVARTLQLQLRPVHCSSERITMAYSCATRPRRGWSRTAVTLALVLIAVHSSFRAVAQVKVYAQGIIQQFPSEDVDFDYFLLPKSVVGWDRPISTTTLLWLQFQNQADKDKCLPGVRVAIIGYNAGFRLYVTSLKVMDSAPPQDFQYGATNIPITSITLLVSACGRPAANTTKIRTLWTMGAASAARADPSYTLEALYRDCSWGKVSFTAANNVIVDLQSMAPPAAVKSAVTCSGNTMTCSGMSSQLQGGPCATLRQIWLNWALNQASTVYGINVSRFDRRVLLIPGLDVFGVSGMAQIGAGVALNTNAFIRGDYAAFTIRSTFHELGHNYGLQHSWANTAQGVLDYGDYSCSMGSVTQGGVMGRCINAPQAWYAGWAEPVATVNHTNLPVGRWQTYTLPGYLSTKTNLVRVVPTWLGTTTPTYFFSYRTPIGRDALLDAQYLNRISVHQFDGTRAAVSGMVPTLWATVVKGAMFDVKAAGYKMRHVSSTGTSATIQLCRYSQVVETLCRDGLDNDCNGVMDSKEPRCQKSTG